MIDFNPFENEMSALHRAGRVRKRTIHPSHLVDLASNDYLGLAHNRTLVDKALERLDGYESYAPKASMLVNGYHPIHKDFENTLAQTHHFDDAIIVGSGFLANIALIEALVRKEDGVIFDADFHASGILASKLTSGKVAFFRHNDAAHLREVAVTMDVKRLYIVVEGVYSMTGDIAPREIFTVADELGAFLIVDEAHSSGVIGPRLLGIFDHYHITPHERHIKMGTLGKAYGSYGAYILASAPVIAFLENRAKSVIYTTALSLFDTAMAYESFLLIKNNTATYQHKIEERQALAQEIIGVSTPSLILPIPAGSIDQLLHWHQTLHQQGFFIGAIRPPTVPSPILRMILRTPISLTHISEALTLIKEMV